MAQLDIVNVSLYFTDSVELFLFFLEIIIIIK
jgi:hypothetical protein